jgi:hypothetical protein
LIEAEMNERFIGVLIVAWIIGLFFGLCLLVGLFVLLDTAFAGAVFVRIPREVQLAAGAVLVFLGLQGLLFSGAVRVLVAIEASTRRAIPARELTKAEQGARAQI